MKEKLKYWWWRVWIFRNEKFKLKFHAYNRNLGDILTYSATPKSSPKSIIHIGKGYFVPCKHVTLDLRPK